MLAGQHDNLATDDPGRQLELVPPCSGARSTLRQCVSFCMWEDVNGLISPKTPKCTGTAVNSKIKYTGGF